MRKKLLPMLILAIGAAVLLVGCGESENEETSASTTITESADDLTISEEAANYNEYQAAKSVVEEIEGFTLPPYEF